MTASWPVLVDWVPGGSVKRKTSSTAGPVWRGWAESGSA